MDANRPFDQKTEQDVPYKDSSLSAGERTEDLLLRMSLEEKAAQMVCIWNQKAEKLLNDEGNFDIKKARISFKDGYGLGQVGRPNDAGDGKDAREMVELTNAIQKFFIEESRLGIPVMFHEECLHGLAARDATSFPQPIGLAGTFNPALIESLYAMAAEETITGIRLLMSIYPAIFGFIAGLIMFFYPLKDSMMVNIEKDLTARGEK